MTIGMRVWDKNGKLVFSEQDFTMRVLGVVQIRLGQRSGRVVVTTALARPGVHAMVNVLPGSYSNYWSPPIATRASLPSVTVENGQLVLNGPAKTNYLANIDVVIVGSA